MTDQDTGDTLDRMSGHPEPAPDALLDRILSSRGSGMRVVLPTDAPGHDLARRTIRMAIAAAIAVVAIGAWSYLRGPVPVKVTRGAATAPFAVSPDFGFATPVEAQSAGAGPRYPAMTFDPSRLHPVHLVYQVKSYRDGKLDDSFVVTWILAQRERGGSWDAIKVRERIEGMGTIKSVDTTRATYAAGSLVESEVASTTHLSDGGVVHSSMVASDTTIRMWSSDTMLNYNVSSVGKGPQVFTHDARDTTVSVPRTTFPRSLTYPSAMMKLMAVAFVPGWQGSEVIPGSRTQRYAYLDFKVTGSQRCGRGPAATACWVLEGGILPSATTLVRKKDGVVYTVHWQQMFNGHDFSQDMVLVFEH